MRTHTERKAALYDRMRRLLAARAQGRIIGRTFDEIARRIRERSQALEIGRYSIDQGERRAA